MQFVIDPCIIWLGNLIITNFIRTLNYYSISHTIFLSIYMCVFLLFACVFVYEYIHQLYLKSTAKFPIDSYHSQHFLQHGLALESLTFLMNHPLSKIKWLTLSTPSLFLNLRVKLGLNWPPFFFPWCVKVLAMTIVDLILKWYVERAKRLTDPIS